MQMVLNKEPLKKPPDLHHLPERHGLAQAIFADVNAHLADTGITLRSGPLVDATIIDAPCSTTNKARARDPEMSSTKKGNDGHFGMKAHINADSVVTHSLETSAAKLHDSQVGLRSFDMFQTNRSSSCSVRVHEGQ